MFVTIKYGADEEKIINPNVLCAVFLNHCRKVCGCENELLDVASEAGEVMDLVSKPKEYAKKYLEPRSTYILVKVTEEGDEGPTYVPMLDTADKIKFAITNPAARQKQKKKEAVKDTKEETLPKKVEKNEVKEKEPKKTVQGNTKATKAR